MERMILPAALFIASAGALSASMIDVTYSAAGIQGPVASICADCAVTFDSLANGLQNYTANFGSGGIAGTYSNLNIVGANLYGGAGGTGKYAAVGIQSGTTSYSLSLNQSVNYFGLWFSAADSQNRLQFYSKGELLSTFSTADLTALVGNCSSAANLFCGNPNSPGRTQDNSEPFAYVNFYGRNGTNFDAVVFSNVGMGSGFESDNHAAYNLVSPAVGGTPITTLAGVPEPSTWLLLCAPLALLTQIVRKRKTAFSI